MNTTVTTEFVKALRKAARNNKTSDRATLVVETNIWGHGNVASFVKLHVEKVNWPGASSTTYITPTGALERISNYGPALAKDVRLVTSANHYATEKGVVASLANLVKVGDTLRLSWVLANGTGNLSKAGFQHDSCFVQIFRGGKFVAELFVNDTICPVGSSALFAYSDLFANRDIPGHVEALIAEIDEGVAA
jgi:hypothetical protein